jgi:hypothetical protein
MTELAETQSAILRRRAIEATWAVLWSVGSAELLFASFAIGATLGPVPLRPIEVLLGSTVFFAIGVIASFWLARKRQEAGSRFQTRVRDGRHERRVVVFDQYLTIGPEVVIKEAITEVALDERGLVLRYRDPRFEGPVLRELSGETADLEELKKRAIAS